MLNVQLNWKLLIVSFFLFLCQAKPLLKKNDIMNLIDPFLADNYDSRQMNLVLLVASLCIQQSSIRRPCMSQVCHVLKFLR